MLSLFLIVCAVILLYKWLMGSNTDYWKKQNIAYVPKTNPLGFTSNLLTQDKPVAVLHKELYDKYQNESYVGIFMGVQPAVLLRDLNDVQAVLSTDFQSFYNRGIFVSSEDVLADNILFMEDYARWKVTRQKLTPVFTSVKLKNMFYIINHCAKDFCSFIAEKDKNKVFDLLMVYTAASIGASVFGIDTQRKNTMDSPFVDMAKKSVLPSLKATLNLSVGSIFPKLQKMMKVKTFGEFEEFFVGVVRSVLKERRSETGRRHDFIDVCLDIQSKGTMKDPQTDYELEPTDELLAAQAFFFFIAGADTSANTMHFTLLELSYNPLILKKVHEEIDRVFESCQDLTHDEINKLVYLEMVVNESMRKYPPIGALQRQCTKDTVLPGGLKMEKGVLAIVSTFSLHRDERHFPNPDLFDPERFAPENIGNIPKFAYLPFGEGKRICVGARYARLHVLGGLAWLLRKYTVVPQEPQNLKFERNFFSLRATDAKLQLAMRS